MNNYIYGLIDPITSELRYIGKSFDPKKRLVQHLEPGQLKQKTHKSRWLNKLNKKGLVPELIILESNLSVEYANEAEQFFIEYFKSIGSRLTNGRPGGDGGAYFDPKRRKKIIDLETGVIYSSAEQVARQFDLDVFHLRVATRGERTVSIKGKYFAYWKESNSKEWVYSELKRRKIKSNKLKPIQIIETGQKFKSVKSIAEFLKVKPRQISRVLSGERTKIRGYSLKILSYEEYHG